MQTTLDEASSNTSPTAIDFTRSWLTASEAAQRIGVYRETIYDACKTGGLKHTRLSGRRNIRIQAESLDAWIAEFATENR
jgi:excisionase family DNA binding protein